MTEANQRILYNNFLKLIDDPKPVLAEGEIRVKGGIDTEFISKQAREQSAAILEVYPHFAETKSKGKK